jgi:hypothetical protein
MTENMNEGMNEVLLQRICGEFLEMPGLRLTSQQAQRLWGLDERTCRELLGFLVEAKFLGRTPQGAYVRLTGGFAKPPRPRTARTHVDTNAHGVRKAV